MVAGKPETAHGTCYGAGCVTISDNEDEHIYTQTSTELARVLLGVAQATLTEDKTMTTEQAWYEAGRLLAGLALSPATPTGPCLPSVRDRALFLLGGPPKAWPPALPRSRNCRQLRVVGAAKAAGAGRPGADSRWATAWEVRCYTVGVFVTFYGRLPGHSVGSYSESHKESHIRNQGIVYV